MIGYPSSLLLTFCFGISEEVMGINLFGDVSRFMIPPMAEGNIVPVGL